MDVEHVIEYVQQNYVDDIVTEVSPLDSQIAENYHHDYFANNPQNPYCQAVVSPKIAKTRFYTPNCMSYTSVASQNTEVELKPEPWVVHLLGLITPILAILVTLWVWLRTKLTWPWE